MISFPGMGFQFISLHCPWTEDEFETHMQGSAFECASEYYLAHISTFKSHKYSHFGETARLYVVVNPQ